jgi:hypothetical protein
MNKPSKITRLHLPVNEQDEPILLGIVATDPDYKLTLKLNKKLNISLKGADPVRITENDSKEHIFSKFSDSRAAPDSVINLYSNRSGNNFLLKKLKNIDYIFLIHDPGNNFITGDLPVKLREIDTVTAVFNIDQKTLNDKNLKYLI